MIWMKMELPSSYALLAMQLPKGKSNFVQKLGLSRRMSTLLPEEIDVIVPSFDAHRRVGGGFSPLLTAKVDRWLRSQVSNPKKLLKVLSEPTTAEQQAGAG